MDENRSKTTDPAAGVPIDAVPDGGSLLGRVGEEDVLLVRRGEELFAVAANCTHYHGKVERRDDHTIRVRDKFTPLATGLQTF
jgi:nitrite reductase/ring-hydroxylating ferredoxin subunit